jgi:hypothetical protein
MRRHNKEPQSNPELEAAFETLLRARTSDAVGAALARNVQREVDFREDARRWLAQHGGLALKPRTAGLGPLPLALPMVQILGAAGAGALAGYSLRPLLLSYSLPDVLLPPVALLGGVGFSAALLCAVVAVTASQWRQLRVLLAG